MVGEAVQQSPGQASSELDGDLRPLIEYGKLEVT